MAAATTRTPSSPAAIAAASNSPSSTTPGPSPSPPSAPAFIASHPSALPASPSTRSRLTLKTPASNWLTLCASAKRPCPSTSVSSPIPTPAGHECPVPHPFRLPRRRKGGKPTSCIDTTGTSWDVSPLALHLFHSPPRRIHEKGKPTLFSLAHEV